MHFTSTINNGTMSEQLWTEKVS